MRSAFQLQIDPNGIARIVFDLPGEKINKLTLEIWEELEKILDDLATNKNIKALIFTSGKEDIFIAGADMTKFEAAFRDRPLLEKMLRTGHRVLNKIQNLPFPTIAVINGTCLGGGTEFALACTYRIVTDHPKTIIGLPEVTLGLYPAWGGSQRLPRLLGLINALPIILTGRPVKADKAYKMHLADAIVPWVFSEQKVAEFVKECLKPEGRKKILNRRKRRGFLNFMLEGNPIGRWYVFHKAKKDVLSKTKGHYPAPLVALNLIKETYTIPLNIGLEKEVQTVLHYDNKDFQIPSNLVHLFFTSEALKKEKGAPEDTPVKKISAAAVLGAGTMGSGFAWLLSNNGCNVRMKDINWEAIGKGFGAVWAIYSKQVRDRKLKKPEANLRFQRISGTTDYSGFQNADMVIEAAVENLDLKLKILSELEGKIRPDAIIGTNTSSLTIKEMTPALRHPERFVGMHFFNPVNKMPLVEVVAGDKTSPQAIATAVELCKKLGKTPIVVGDCPGFLVNRIFVISANEIMTMLEEGISMERIEKLMLGFGMPMSPFILSDEVGNDVGYKVAKSFEHAYGDRMKTPRMIQLMNDNKLYGKKTGEGFYIYKGDSRKVNPKVNELLSTINAKKSELSDTDIRDRAILPMINEASRCLEEGIIKKPEYLDMALIMGIGFPPFRGGLLRYADTLGPQYIVDRLKKFEGQWGPRFKPSNYLLEMQKNNKTFYAV